MLLVLIQSQRLPINHSATTFFSHNSRNNFTNSNNSINVYCYNTNSISNNIKANRPINHQLTPNQSSTILICRLGPTTVRRSQSLFPYHQHLQSHLQSGQTSSSKPIDLWLIPASHSP